MELFDQPISLTQFGPPPASSETPRGLRYCREQIVFAICRPENTNCALARKPA